jgi:hypothetical protein
MGLIDESGQPIRDPDRAVKTPQQGASTSVFAATSPLLAGIGGVYLKDNDISPLDTPRPSTSAPGGPSCPTSYHTPSTRTRHND